ncbi:hypothetical protein KMZ14_00375 [Acinetobacter schindleri]|uniref:hypothetical protein n=1 Tax=Acinetobacter schindleri TaxID=108981 RepID=UPI00235F4EB9|nr:hypothetical protein [Acinetobacter schindleri]WDE16079.1 hypothetical protein KMZ14_00375 [Acinetobacter schindleri]
MLNNLNSKLLDLLYLFIVIIMSLRVFSNFNFFSNSLAVLAPLLIIPLGVIYIAPKLMDLGKPQVNINIFLFVLICVFLLLIPTLQNIFLDNLFDYSGRNSHQYVWTISLLALSWVFAGAVIGCIRNVTIFFKCVTYAFFFIFAICLIYALNGGWFIDYQFLTNLRNDDIKIHHLSLTEPLMLIFFMVLAFLYNTKIKWIVVFAILFFMFALGGRVAFLCYILAILIYEFLSSKVYNYLPKLLFIGVVGIYIFLSLSTDLNDNFEFNKLFLSDGIENDESFKGRMQFFKDFGEGALTQVVIGNPNFFIIRHNDLGTYAHNILSLFQFYGLILFIIILFSLLFIVKKIYILRLYLSDDVLIKFGILFFIYTFFSVLIGKAVLFSSLWFILGFWFFKLRNIQVLKNVRS